MMPRALPCLAGLFLLSALAIPEVSSDLKKQGTNMSWLQAYLAASYLDLKSRA